MKEECFRASIGRGMIPGEAYRTGWVYVQDGGTCNKIMVVAPIPRGSVQIYITIATIATVVTDATDAPSSITVVTAEDTKTGDGSVCRCCCSEW